MFLSTLESNAVENDEPLMTPEDAAERDHALSVIAEAVLDDNAELMKEVSGLRWLCLALIKGNLPVELGLGKRLEEFEEKLLLHFASEETEEFLATLVTDQPSLVHRAAKVQAEQ